VLSPREIEKSTLKLFTDSKIMENKKEILRNDFYRDTCPFKPEINDKNPPNIINFYGRLQNWIDKRNIHTIKNLNDASKDSLTGQPYFTPKFYTSKYSRNVRIFIYIFIKRTILKLLTN